MWSLIIQESNLNVAVKDTVLKEMLSNEAKLSRIYSVRINLKRLLILLLMKDYLLQFMFPQN